MFVSLINQSKILTMEVGGVHHHFAPGRFTYAPVFSDDALLHTTIKNTEELVQNIF